MPKHMTFGRGLIYVFLVGLSVVFLMPIVVVILNSFRPETEILSTSLIGLPRHLSAGNWISAWSTFCVDANCSGVRPYLWNSLAMTVPATCISTMFGALNGYTLSLWRFRGDTWVFGMIALGVFLPGQSNLVPWTIVLRSLGLYNTIAGLVLIHVLQGTSFCTLFCRNYYTGIPRDLIRAARVDGAGFLRTFVRIVLPLSPPILVVTVVWQFTGIWNEFLYGVTFSSGPNQPITAALIALSAHIEEAPQYGVQAAAVLLAAAPPLILYLFAGRYFVRGLTVGAVK
jgi:glucose/mannose transport system permease protein